MSLDSESKKSLRQKVEDADLALALKKRADNDTTWADAQIELSDALLELADAEDSDENALGYYKQAADGFKEALEVYTCKTDLARWGGITVSCVRCLRNLSIRENTAISVLRLKHCLTMLDDVYQALPDNNSAVDRALVLTEKGHVHRALADIDLIRERHKNLECALNAFDSSASILRQKENFHFWSLAISASAFVSSELARMETADKLQDGLKRTIERFETALAYFQDNEQPQDLSYLYFELGRVLTQLATIADKDEQRPLLEKAIDAFGKAGSTLNDDMNDNVFVRLQNETAMALSLLAQQKTDAEAIALLEKSVALYRNNIERIGEDGDPVIKAVLYGNLGKDLTQIANLISVPSLSLEKRYQAINALRHAIGREIKNVRMLDWLSYFVELGAALQAAGNLEAGEKRNDLFREAIKLYTEALQEIPQPHKGELVIKLLQWRALARANLGEKNHTQDGMILLKQAELDFRMALAKLDQNENKPDLFRLYVNLAHLLYTMARRTDSENPEVLLQSANDAVLAALSINGDDFDQTDDEHLAAISHRALILWRLGNISGDETHFLIAQNIYEELMKAQLLHDNPENLMRVKNNYAHFLMDWSDKLSTAGAELCLEKTTKLLDELQKFAQVEQDEQALCEYNDMLLQVKDKQSHLTRKWWHKLWPFNKCRKAA